MTYAEIQAAITAIGKDKIVGFGIDNNRRVYRKVVDGVIEPFDSRFVFNETLDMLVTIDRDPTGIEFQTYTLIGTIQSIMAVTDVTKAGDLDKRYAVG